MMVSSGYSQSPTHYRRKQRVDDRERRRRNSGIQIKRHKQQHHSDGTGRDWWTRPSGVRSMSRCSLYVRLGQHNLMLMRGGSQCSRPVLLMPWHESNGIPSSGCPVIACREQRIIGASTSRRPVPSRPASVRLDGNGHEGGLLRVHSRAVRDGSDGIWLEMAGVCSGER